MFFFYSNFILEDTKSLFKQFDPIWGRGGGREKIPDAIVKIRIVKRINHEFIRSDLNFI